MYLVNVANDQGRFYNLVKQTTLPSQERSVGIKRRDETGTLCDDIVSGQCPISTLPLPLSSRWKKDKSTLYLIMNYKLKLYINN